MPGNSSRGTAKKLGKCYNRAQLSLPQPQTRFKLWPPQPGEIRFQSALLGRLALVGRDWLGFVLLAGWGGRSSTSHKLSFKFSFANKNLVILIHKTWKPKHQLPLNSFLPLTVYDLSARRVVQRSAVATAAGSLLGMQELSTPPPTSRRPPQ